MPATEFGDDGSNTTENIPSRKSTLAYQIITKKWGSERCNEELHEAEDDLQHNTQNENTKENINRTAQEIDCKMNSSGNSLSGMAKNDVPQVFVSKPRYSMELDGNCEDIDSIAVEQASCGFCNIKPRLSLLNEIYTKNTVEKLTKAKITIEPSLFSTYTYVHSDNRQLLYAKRTICGFNIYSFEDRTFIAHMKSNLFGTKYTVEKKYLLDGIENRAPRSETNKNINFYSIGGDSKMDTAIDQNCESGPSPHARTAIHPSFGSGQVFPSNHPHGIPLYNTPADFCNFEVFYDVTFLKRDKPRSFIIDYDKIKLTNKSPIYNPETNSYSLNFSGRVTTASVKNFQIIHPLDPTYITLTFGKENNNVYILDYTHPWNIFRAFCVGLTALDHKLGFD